MNQPAPASATRRQTRIFATLMLLGAGLWLCACAGCAPRVVRSDDALKFGQGVAAVRAQTLAAFGEINDLTTHTSIERAVARPTLRDSDLPVVLGPAQVQQWENALGEIEAYANHLVALLSTEAPGSLDASAVALANRLKETRPSAVPDPGVAAAFAGVGRVLLAQQVQHDARKIARAADADVRAVLLGLAEVIGEGAADLDAGAEDVATDSPATTRRAPARRGARADETSRTLRGTVAANYRLQLDELRVSFLEPNADKRRIVLDYIRLRDRRDAHDYALASLRGSLRSLADAHTALAAGGPAGLDSILAGIRQELKSTRDLFDRLKAVEDAAAAAEKEQERLRAEREARRPPGP
jgi:hypothetical protein